MSDKAPIAKTRAGHEVISVDADGKCIVLYRHNPEMKSAAFTTEVSMPAGKEPTWPTVRKLIDIGMVDQENAEKLRAAQAGARELSR